MFSSADIPSPFSDTEGVVGNEIMIDQEESAELIAEAVNGSGYPMATLRPAKSGSAVYKRKYIHENSDDECTATEGDVAESKSAAMYSYDGDISDTDQGNKNSDDESKDETYVPEKIVKKKSRAPRKKLRTAKKSESVADSRSAASSERSRVALRLNRLIKSINCNDTAEVLRYAKPEIVNLPCHSVPGFEGSNTFLMSIWNRNADITNVILGRGADLDFHLDNVNLKEHGMSVAAVVAFWKCSQSLAVIYQYLKTYSQSMIGRFSNAKVTAGEYVSYTPLMLACLQEDLSTVNLLLNNGARVHHVANDGKTALLLAKNPEILAVVTAALTRRTAAMEANDAAAEAQQIQALSAAAPSSSLLSAGELLHQKIAAKDAAGQQLRLELRQQQKAATEKLGAYLQRLRAEASEFAMVESKGENNKKIMPHQFQAISEYIKNREKFLSNENKNPNAVFEFPTGSGKTYIFNKIATESGEVTLIVVPRENLLEQTLESFREFSPESVGTIGVMRSIENGGTLNGAAIKALFENKKIIITTYKTLEMYHRHIPKKKVAHLVLDEGHNALSSQRVALVEKFRNGGTFVSVFTATPVRDEVSTQQVVASCYTMLGYENEKENPVTPLEVINAIDIGASVPVVTARIMLKPVNDESLIISSPAYHISEKDSRRVLNKPEYNQAIVDIYMNGEDAVSGKAFRGDQGVAFCSGIDHAIAMANEFNKIPVDAVDASGVLREKYVKNVEAKFYQDEKLKFYKLPENANKVFHAGVDCPVFSEEQKQAVRNRFCVAKAVYSKAAFGENREALDSKECQEILEQYKLGGILVLAGADKLTEGFDCKGTSLIFKARATLSRIVNKQSAGRGSRPDPSNPNKICYVFDVQAGDTISLNFSDCLVKDGKPQATLGDVNRCRQSHVRNTQAAIPVFSGKMRADYCAIDWAAPAALTHDRILTDRRLRKEQRAQEKIAERVGHQQRVLNERAEKSARRKQKHLDRSVARQAEREKRKLKSQKKHADKPHKISHSSNTVAANDSSSLEGGFSGLEPVSENQSSSFFSQDFPSLGLFGMRGSLSAYITPACSMIEISDDEASEDEIDRKASQLDNLRDEMSSILTNHSVVSIKPYLSNAWRMAYAALVLDPLSVSLANQVASGLMNVSRVANGLGSRTEMAKQIITVAGKIAALVETCAANSLAEDEEKSEYHFESDVLGNDETIVLTDQAQVVAVVPLSSPVSPMMISADLSIAAAALQNLNFLRWSTVQDAEQAVSAAELIAPDSPRFMHNNMG
jgi:superfamily II DNA or RNA helicase